MENFWKRAVKETLLAGIASTVFCLFATALFAVFVRAYAPSELTVVIVCRVLECVGVFGSALLFVRRGRALFKGMAAGLCSLLVTTLVFGIIGGFHFTPLLALQALLCLLFGGAGALCGAKFGKET